MQIDIEEWGRSLNVLHILIWIYVYYIERERLSWSNDYLSRKWTQRPGFKSGTRFLTFYMVLITFGKIRIQLFSLQLNVNSHGRRGLLTKEKENSEINLLKLHLKIDLVLHPARAKVWLIYIYIYILYIYIRLNVCPSSDLKHKGWIHTLI